MEDEQHGEVRAQYGTRLIKTLAGRLVPKYGSTFSKRNLEYFRQFYLCFNDLEIVNAYVHNLTWTDKVMAKYSVLNGSDQLFAAKYMAYMPTEEELSREIEQQKRFFMEQHGKKQ